jgi:hypothetical protein
MSGDAVEFVDDDGMAGWFQILTGAARQGADSVRGPDGVRGPAGDQRPDGVRGD